MGKTADTRASVTLTEQDKVEAGEVMIAYLDAYSSGGGQPPAADFLARCSNERVREAVRLHIATAQSLFALRTSGQEEGSD